MKSIAQVLAEAVPAVGDLKAFLVERRAELVKFKEEWPDTAPAVDRQIAELDAKVAVLDSVIDATALRDLAIVVVKELGDIPSQGLQPKPHPGDVTGG